jgi:signal peptidase II
VRGAALATGLLLLDQASKWWAFTHLESQIKEITPFFNLVLVWNNGVSFGMFQSGHAAGPYILSVLALLIMAMLGLWLRRTARALPFMAICAVMAGAAGNVIDRVRFRAVIDFLDFHAFGYHWPAFNVADCCVVVGIAFLLLDGLFFEPRQQQAENHD